MRGDAGKGRPKLSDQDKLFVCIALMARRYSIASIARSVGVTPKTIYNVRMTYLGY